MKNCSSREVRGRQLQIQSPLISGENL